MNVSQSPATTSRTASAMTNMTSGGPGGAGATATRPTFASGRVTDDDDESRATNLSIRKLRQLFRYRCELCKPEFDLQRHTYNHQFDVKTARDRVLDAVAERGGQITVRQLATAWKYQIAQTRRR